VPEGLKPVYVHRQSRPLSKILAEMLRASNNYIANQVFLEIGGHRLGGPVSLEKSLTVANEMLAAHGLATDIHLEEGSGISRDNRFTIRGLAKVLELFAPHADLLHGHDGGMNKTGTMDGICTLAGYADTSSRGRVRFVISLTSNDDEMRFRLLRAIESGLVGFAVSCANFLACGGSSPERLRSGQQLVGASSHGAPPQIASRSDQPDGCRPFASQ